MTRPCSVEDCGRPYFANGYCSLHRNRLVKYGRLHRVQPIPLSEVARNGLTASALLPYVDVESAGCWSWRGSTDRGYGRVSVNDRLVYAHRFVWECMRGAIPPGLQLDHLCRNRRCVNPDHLEPVTHIENCRRRDAALPARSHCRRGHDLATHAYVSADGRRRYCRECRRLRGRAA